MSADTKAKVNMRISSTALEEIDRAAKLQGLDRTSFMVAASSSRARAVLIEDRILNITEREAAQILDIYDQEKVPTEALKDAAKKLKEMGL